MKCFTVMYSYVHTKLQSHTLVILSANTDLAVLANNRREGSSDICDRYNADAVLFWPKDERVVVCMEKYARKRGHSEYARNSLLVRALVLNVHAKK